MIASAPRWGLREGDIIVGFANRQTGVSCALDMQGYRVTTVGDGPAALEILRQQQGEVNLVILDLMLPGMSGYAVCESLRAFDMDTPVLILTARTLTEDRTRGFAAGANQYLTKPFDPADMLATLRLFGLYDIGRTSSGEPLDVAEKLQESERQAQAAADAAAT